MKKLMFTLSLALFVFAGNIYAQAPAAGTSTDEATVKTKTPGGKTTTLHKGAQSKAAAQGKFKASPTKKAKVMKHKDEIKANADNKEEAKEYIQEQHQNSGDVSQKDKVKSHRAEIKAKAGSKEEAKSKLQRKHEKNKTE